MDYLVYNYLGCWCSRVKDWQTIVCRIHLDCWSYFFCSLNCCQYFPHKKTALMRKEFWKLSYEDQKAYGLDIPWWLHSRIDVKKQNFITIQGFKACEKGLYTVVGLAWSTYMMYKQESLCDCRFLLHGNKRMKKQR